MTECSTHSKEDCEICAFYDGPVVPILLGLYFLVCTIIGVGYHLLNWLGDS